MSSSSRSPSRSSSQKSKSRKRKSRNGSPISESERHGDDRIAEPEEGSITSPAISGDRNVDVDLKDISLPSSRPTSLFLTIETARLPQDIPLPPSPPVMNASSPLQEPTDIPSTNQNVDLERGQTLDQSGKDGSENLNDRVFRVRNEPERTGWARMYDLVREYDKNRVVDNKEDIDTLLVFAGLFSAVVTAFIIESYKTLQQQPEDLTNILLMQLINQTSHLSINGNLINSTIPVLNIPSFETSRVSSAINTLWILSLLIALITASLGILVKQWFHELLSYKTHDPMERLKLRFFREAGVERWKVFAIASALPLLLQLALLFFFVGLALFFQQLDTIVAWFTTGTAILWLVSLLFATLTPTFSSQCPYKTPFLKDAISRLRVAIVALPGTITWWLYQNTSRRRFPRVKAWFDQLDGGALAWMQAWDALEEESVAKNGSLSLPVVSYTRDLLQGERLWDSILECIRGIPPQDMKTTVKEIEQLSSHMYRVLPSIPGGLDINVGTFLLDAAQNTPSQPVSFRQEIRTLLYPALIRLQSKAHIPDDDLVPPDCPAAFIHLIRADPTSAAFSFLIMYSIRHCTLKDHPDSFDHLFAPLIYEKHFHGIGDQFLSNLLTATKSLIHSIWNQPQDESDDIKIAECVEAIRTNAHKSDPVLSPDPISFINVFAIVLINLVPRDIVRRRKDEIHDVMGELAEIIVKFDGSSWSQSRSECVRSTYRFIQILDLQHGHLGSKLRALGLTLPLSDNFKELFNTDFEQDLPLHSC